MPNQLAPKSVRTYHLSPEGYTAARNKVLRHSAVIFAGIILFVFVLAYKMFGQIWRQSPIAAFLSLVVSVLVTFGALAAGLRKGIKRSQEAWDSFELTICEDFVIVRKKDFAELEIQRHEVTRIRESTTGLYVETKFKDRTIGIARALTNYEDARERLSRWMQFVHEPPPGWTAPTRWMWIYPVISIVLFALVLMSTNSWVVIASGVPLVIGLSVSIWLIRRSVQTSAHMKRSSLLTLIPLLAIIARLIQAFQRLR